MSELTKHIDAILDAYSGVPDDEANQPMTLTVPVRDLRTIAKALRPEGRNTVQWQEVGTLFPHGVVWHGGKPEVGTILYRCKTTIGAPQPQESKP